MENAINDWLSPYAAQRREREESHVSTDDFEVESREPPPFAELLREETRAEVAGLIDLAVPKHQEILRRCFLDGASWGDVAAEFGYHSAGKAASMVNRMVAKLKRKVERLQHEHARRDRDQGGLLLRRGVGAESTQLCESVLSA
jgi:DNA-directed RNA polymerase specialized sigma24 family protein